ncbi:MAG: hypothetical protein FD145_577 [Candidatus Saganbacteria bacterium]|uniref:Uncharacterized protein n=1 Tax=Candidatus Saganbacteria bacterium TaxID=2575572 RepID=A0A833L1K1_UNCSA|nr:MAG: hypothetical protein FD145_577 [Candidatus Saganbacteria bacterium]
MLVEGSGGKPWKFSFYSIFRPPIVREGASVRTDLRALDVKFSPIMSSMVDKLSRLPEETYNGLIGCIKRLKERYSLDTPTELLLPKLDSKLMTYPFKEVPPKLLWDQYYQIASDLPFGTLDLRRIEDSRFRFEK